MKLIEIPFEDPDKCKKRLSSYLRQAFIFTSSYEWMINSYVAEFFVKDFWERFPTSWRICFETLTLDEIAELILSNNAGKTYRFVWPLSLLSYLASCHYLAFDRTQKLFSEKHQTLLKRFPFLMTKHIKPKKRHELSILPNLISKVCNQAGVENVIDVGSGLGHLSRMLSIEHKLDVTAIEMAEERLPLAEQFDKQLAKEIEICSKLEEKQFGKVRHIAQKIHPSITNKQFYELVGYQENFNSSNCDDKAAVLVGLHTCGDLASTMVRMFKNTNGLKGLVSISCCYMGMTLHDSNVSNDVLIGFPMSNTVSKLNYKSLKYKSFETACHFVDDYITKLTTASPNLKLHCYRAVMEVILRELNPGMVLTSVRCRKIKNAANMSFVEYAEKVLERVNLKIDWNAMKHIDHELLLLKWKNVVIYHCLVHLMGPVVESIVLADKWIFLLEQGFKANLLPIFNPSVSPRNFALIAIK